MENGNQALVPVVFGGPGGQQGHSQGQDQVDQQQQAEDFLHLAAGEGGRLDQCRAQSRAGENLEERQHHAGHGHEAVVVGIEDADDQKGHAPADDLRRKLGNRHPFQGMGDFSGYAHSVVQIPWSDEI